VPFYIIIVTRVTKSVFHYLASQKVFIVVMQHTVLFFTICLLMRFFLLAG